MFHPRLCTTGNSKLGFLMWRVLITELPKGKKNIEDLQKNKKKKKLSSYTKANTILYLSSFSIIAVLVVSMYFQKFHFPVLSPWFLQHQNSKFIPFYLRDKYIKVFICKHGKKESTWNFEALWTMVIETNTDNCSTSSTWARGKNCPLFHVSWTMTRSPHVFFHIIQLLPPSHLSASMRLPP